MLCFEFQESSPLDKSSAGVGRLEAAVRSWIWTDARKFGSDKSS